MFEMANWNINPDDNAWVNAMRASSPTRSSCDDDGEKQTWIADHPSALCSFEEITSAAVGKQLVIFLDYDGTLSPIVTNPDEAYMDDEMREAVKHIAEVFPTAIVTGRCKDKIYDFVKLPWLYYAASHGMDIEGPSSCKHHKGNETVLRQPANAFLPMIDEVYEILIKTINDVVGANVENNKFCLSVHYRCVEEQSWEELAGRVRSILEDYPMLKLKDGRKVLEIRPAIEWDKGYAVEFLLESLGFKDSKDIFPICIGDDKTDEDAFKVLRKRGQGISIVVSEVPKETNAHYSLENPSEVKQFLQQLATWKHSVISG